MFFVDHVFVYNGPYLKKNSTGYLHGKIVSTPYIPLNILKFAKIDYYFKGFEYRNKNIPEMDLLNKYGIKVKFGPKKNIFSSSSIIKNYNKNDN